VNHREEAVGAPAVVGFDSDPAGRLEREEDRVLLEMPADDALEDQNVGVDRAAVAALGGVQWIQAGDTSEMSLLARILVGLAILLGPTLVLLLISLVAHLLEPDEVEDPEWAETRDALSRINLWAPTDDEALPPTGTA